MPAEREGGRGSAIALAIALAAALWPGVGCSGDTCIRHSDCDPGLVCSPLGTCAAAVEPGGDAGDDAEDAPDAGADAGADAGVDAPLDAATDAATDGATDAVPDAVPPILESPYANPGGPTMNPSPPDPDPTSGTRSQP